MDCLEKHALRAWECVVSKVNHDLVWKQSSPVYIIPANVVLTELVSRSLSDFVVEQFSERFYLSRLKSLFSDDVHLTNTGVYYIGLVTYASIFNSSPEGAWFPNGISGKMALYLRNIAWKLALNKVSSIHDLI